MAINPQVISGFLEGYQGALGQAQQKRQSETDQMVKQIDAWNKIINDPKTDEKVRTVAQEHQLSLTLALEDRLSGGKGEGFLARLLGMGKGKGAGKKKADFDSQARALMGQITQAGQARQGDITKSFPQPTNYSLPQPADYSMTSRSSLPPRPTTGIDYGQSSMIPSGGQTSTDTRSPTNQWDLDTLLRMR